MADAGPLIAALQKLLEEQKRDDARRPVNWSLLKVLSPKKLDLSEATVSTHKLWESGVHAFIKETDLAKYDWATQAMCLQATMTDDTFLKVDALRQHMDVDAREDLELILPLVKNLVEGTSNKWLERQKFHKLTQGADTARQFYTKAVEVARDCEFDSNYCNQCKSKAVDDRLVDKLVFGCQSESARRALLKKKDLTLEAAKEALERQEALKETESSLQEHGHHSEVGAIGGDRGGGRRWSHNRGRGSYHSRDSRDKSGQRSQPCDKCGLSRHSANGCPAKGSDCRNCGGVGHWAKTCRQPKKYGNRQPRRGRNSHIISMMATTTERVKITCEGRKHSAVIDTGSDWTCTSPAKLESDFKEFVGNLIPPTEEMINTKNASGQRMDALGFFTTDFDFGSRKVEEDLVVFGDLEDTYLSKPALVKLGIVIINTTPPDAEINNIKSKKKRKNSRAKKSKLKSEPENPAESNDDASRDADSSSSSQSASQDIDDSDEPATHREKPSHGPPPIPPRIDKPYLIKGKDTPLARITRQDLLEEFADVFAFRSQPMEGEEFKIVLKPDAQPTKIYRARPVPYHWEKKLKEEIDKLVRENVIEKITHATEWCHPVVCARKKNDDLRMCIDFRPLNKHTLREPHHHPPIIDVVQSIRADDAKFFASADATAGYNQCKLADASRDLTTFIVPSGRFRYKRAPFGVVSISDHFNRRMDELLEGLTSLVRVVDDTLVYGRTEAELAKNTIKFLQRCREKGIRLNEKKFNYKETVIAFAGCLIRDDGFTIDPKVNQALREYPEPTSLTEVKGFNGLASQLAPYDAQLAKKLHPLRHLLRSKTPVVELNEEERRAFREAKIRLSSPEVLAYFRPGRPLELYTDAACTKGFGFLLQQLQPDNTWRPLMLGSRVLLDAETRYAPIEAEVTAMAWALRKARKFLLGAQRFKVFTDHRPLVSLVNSKRYDEIANNRILRNVLKCRDFNMEVEYIKGANNIAADALSRAPIATIDAADLAESEEINHQVRAIRTQTLADAELSLQEEEILEAGELDPEYRRLRDQIRQGFPNSKRDLDECLQPYWPIKTDLMVAEDDLVLYGTRLVIPKSERQNMLKRLHVGHRGIVGTKARAKMTVYWPNLNNQIEQTVRQCELCQEDRPTQPSEPEIHFPVPERCFEYLSADLADCEGKKYLITTDWKSGWFAVRQLRKSDATNIIHELRLQFMDTAVPTVFFSDNGPPFNSKEFANFCRRWGVRHVTSSPYYAQSNTYAENGVKNAKSLIRKCHKQGRGMNWDEWSQGLLAIRNTPHANTGLSPAVILYGHQVKEILPAHKSALSKEWHKELSCFDHTIAKARQTAEKYRKGRELPPLKIGDPVIVQNRTTKRWDKFAVIQEKNDKFRKYILRLPSGLITVRNRRDIKKRFPPTSVPNAGARDWNPYPDDSEDDDDESDDEEDTPPTPNNRKSKPETKQSPPNSESGGTPSPVTPPNPGRPHRARRDDDVPPTQTSPNPDTAAGRPNKARRLADDRRPRPILTSANSARPPREKKLPVKFKDYNMDR